MKFEPDPISVDYDQVAPVFDQRYARRQYEGTRRVLQRFVGDPPAPLAIEIGCGTGHWLRELAGRVTTLAGMDLSWGMLQRAREAAPGAHLVRADAVRLPWATASADRIFCINVLHHIHDRPRFLQECRRVLRPGGAFLTVASDPHTGNDTWWVYDYFPSALGLDRERYPSTPAIRELLSANGFEGTTTEVAEHFQGVLPFATARERGSLDRRATSQIMLLSDEDYDRGMARLSVEQPMLRIDLRLWATTARVPVADR